ncbi:MAG: ATP-binding cassette domain-containing protein [Bacteroidetes bacterium]|nr:ATP-binding cassette domain-containing protein [Bacteroidota bacterium]
MARGQNLDIPKAKLNKENLREGLTIFRYLKPYRTKFIIGLIFITLSSLSTMAFPYLLGEMINSAKGVKSESALNFTMGTIAIIMIALLVLQMLFSFMRVYLFTSVGENAVADMRKDIYQHLIKMPMEFYAQRRVGELSSRISADITQIQDAVSVMLAELIRGILTLLIGIALILYISFKLTLVMLSVIPIVIAIALIFSKIIRKYSRMAQDQLADSGTIVHETLQGVANVKAFNNEWYEIKRYNKSISDVVRFAVRNGRIRGMFISFLLFSVFGAIVLVVWYAMTMNMPLGDLVKFVTFTGFVGGTMAGFADLYSQFQKTIGATQRVREILKEKPENVNVTLSQIKPEFKLKGNVTLKNISFKYPSRPDVQVLKDLNIDAEAGQQIAIVGPSGAGKSTIVSLLLRFYEPQNGHIYFDGQEAQHIPLSQLRAQIALVPQDVLLFGGTIYDNIAYGKPDATKEEIEQAARKANAHDFIVRFPEGYNTVVGERGLKLSGGQRQRIAIARAMLKDPIILVLDEATSSLDSESESLVQDALYKLMKNRTSFVIAHRLSTIKNADKIVVLEHGQIKEQGKHVDLLQLEDGLYKSLSKLQFEA